MSEHNTRRNFLKFSTLAGLGISANPLTAFSSPREKEGKEMETSTPIKQGQQIVSLLQTTDVHCQLHHMMNSFGKVENQCFAKQVAMQILPPTSI